jgi:hypothetical protein
MSPINCTATILGFFQLKGFFNATGFSHGTPPADAARCSGQNCLLAAWRFTNRKCQQLAQPSLTGVQRMAIGFQVSPGEPSGLRHHSIDVLMPYFPFSFSSGTATMQSQFDVFFFHGSTRHGVLR